VTGGDPTEEIVEHLFALVDSLRAGFESAAAAFDLSPVQAKVLRYVAASGPLPMRDVACRMRCDASNVTGIIDRLEDRGLVERRASSADRRVRTLVATARGDEVARAVWTAVQSGAVAQLGMDDDDRLTLLRLLGRLDHVAPR
jgi:DNA-binding MarR family transcriptional regulator